MPRVLRVGNFAVYVYDERGQPHHLPHAHIKERDRLVASIYLATLEVYHCRGSLPRTLLDAIRREQEGLIERWKELNGDD
jgi:hypothetical protein